MNHQDHVDLLKDGIPSPGGVWADYGSGRGAFTLALVDLIGPSGIIYSIDKDSSALRQQEQAMLPRFTEVRPIVHYLHADFTRPIDLPALDGVVMANALHFQRNKEPVLKRIRASLRTGGRFILVEYNVDRGNFWVPYPLSFRTWQNLAERVGFADTRLLATVPSHFLKEVYSALSIVN